ncbi:UDP-N-acetylglucosamine/UDP-glucose/GDP-mannose transporter isoform X1 [Falco biarmicus]|uniref:Sugar phosphate transporter domain-containing protein n=2 Tax=Falco TaxID=8952 RepID=A0A8C4TY41_FALTI|nr:UDP-N-acetylglucosamine/UDP-glucose/GDP-mannose transporter isoform X1 [Falco rusticolus]XP_040435717.1 UDP-N-acetylglucosamine/UDP-glucose/GDP-mannose transporter isoform X1 [Falco naumanni]XP_055555093.1 UDP-N-acetylglucosamine/UDP-glucose/GDP-mannose transporter isoform X1 [Falco cherrug]XP_055646904.1 UDP-N-acetylglucosamine/UDP-glucose/GDP-mannose transporter isoform X1 [Falco peregrinus]XP_056180643.1 UDP-N-acetylglucosamine/UDP-glucose/GDP-mannose transporter isoform X1 [Falco biarmic
MSARPAVGEVAGGAAPPALPRVLSALFYGTCSFLIVLVNKALLSAYSFPSPMFLGIGQMAATILILYVSKLNKIVHFPDFDKSIPVKLFPLPLIYVGNHISGLSSTSKLSLPMFTVLRKFTIPLTLLLEIIILGKRYPLSIIVSVFAIILGAFIAAGSDLSFNLEGYTFVLLNDIFTAANGVYTKQKIDPKELGKYGVLFYNACFMVVPTVIISFSTGDFQQVTHFQHWTNFLFVFQFILSCLLGFLLMYSTVLCSHYNSALTTTVVGAIKNISVAYIGMLIGGDYIFSVLNFIGLNICMAGGLRYSFLTLRGNSKPMQPGDEENALPEAKS